MSAVFTFRKLTFGQRLLLLVWPAYRRRYEADLKAGIRWLVEHPELPVEFE